MHCTRTESIYRRKGMGWGGTHDRKGQDVTLRGSLPESKRNEQDKSERGEAAMAADCCRRRRHCRRPEPHLCCCWPPVVAAADGLRPLHGLTSRPSAAPAASRPAAAARPLWPLRGQPIACCRRQHWRLRRPSPAALVGCCWAAIGLLLACVHGESSGDLNLDLEFRIE